MCRAETARTREHDGKVGRFGESASEDEMDVKVHEDRMRRKGHVSGASELSPLPRPGRNAHPPCTPEAHGECNTDATLLLHASPPLHKVDVANLNGGHIPPQITTLTHGSRRW